MTLSTSYTYACICVCVGGGLALVSITRHHSHFVGLSIHPINLMESPFSLQSTLNYRIKPM